MTKYDQACADFEALEAICELDDQVELDSSRLELMQEPTKAKAAELYESGIQLWFQENRSYPSLLSCEVAAEIATRRAIRP